jgi:tRNA threonylcarbamoyladenosine biosynthesis protein TsaE
MTPTATPAGTPAGTPAEEFRRFEPATADDTRALGRALAGVLRAGDLVVLAGPLGAGKTVLAQGVGDGLGVVGPVTSPTFVIARVHRPDLRRGGALPMVHVDAYRLGDASDPLAEIDDLDLDATLEESVTLVEWGESLVERLADGYLVAHIDRLDDDRRVVELVSHGGDWAARLAQLRLL